MDKTTDFVSLLPQKKGLLSLEIDNRAPLTSRASRWEADRDTNLSSGSKLKKESEPSTGHSKKKIRDKTDSYDQRS